LKVLGAIKPEAEEADWWFGNRKRLDQDLPQAAKKGQLKWLNRTKLRKRLEASKTLVVSLRLPEIDIELAARVDVRKVRGKTGLITVIECRHRVRDAIDCR
jgi:hypothetical protein